MNIIWNNEDYLMHYGMPRRSGRYKWGSGKNPFHHGKSNGMRKKHDIHSMNPRVIISKRQNKKIDKSFEKWRQGAAARDKAIESGKKRNELKIQSIKDPSNKQLRKDYKQSEKQYKKDLRKNTTYRKGSVREQVGRDLARKHLSAAKKSDTGSEYRQNMKNYEIERAKARRAQMVGATRSQKKAAIKRALKVSIKIAIAVKVTKTAAKIVSKYGKDKMADILTNPDAVNTAFNVVNTAFDAGKRASRYVY